MADSFYKSLDVGKDVVGTRTLLHEAIPLTGTIVSGTYGTNNIKNYAHGMFQSVYDYPYLSSSANHIFDITVGVSSKSSLYSSVATQKSKKLNIYNQMAQVLVGYDATGSVLQFDEDGDILAGGNKLDNVIFLNFSRLLTKDEIKKGQFQLDLGVTPLYAEDGTVFADRLQITDASGSGGYLVNSPVGDYGILYATASAGTAVLAANQSYPVGLLYYQAGVAVLSGSIFLTAANGGILNNSFHNVSMSGPSSITETINAVLTGSAITGSADNLRTRMYNLQFNNTVELNSSILMIYTPLGKSYAFIIDEFTSITFSPTRLYISAALFNPSMVKIFVDGLGYILYSTISVSIIPEAVVFNTVIFPQLFEFPGFVPQWK